MRWQKWDVKIHHGCHYKNGRLCLPLMDVCDGELVTVATVNLPDEDLDDNEVCIKDYSEKEGMLKMLVDNDVVEPPHRFVKSGFVTIPVCHLKPLDMDEIVDRLIKRGINAQVWHSGGGCATIYATGKTGGPQVLAGPGYFAGRNWTKPGANRDDFSVGIDLDDPGVKDPAEFDELGTFAANVGTTIDDVVKAIADRVALVERKVVPL